LCVVHLTVPKNGKGKVNVEVGGALKTMYAISETEEFKTGSLVKVTGVVDNILVVGKSK